MFEPGDNLQTVELGNADVENDQVGFLLAHQPHGIDAIVGFTDHIQVFALEQHANGEADNRVIIDDQRLMHLQSSLALRVRSLRGNTSDRLGEVCNDMSYP
ncbi:hypothetical protein D3C80_1442400 [compost metagenome]